MITIFLQPLLKCKESGKTSPPEKVVGKTQEGRRKADDAVHEGIAEGIGCHAQHCCRQAYGNIERPKIGGGSHPCPGCRGALHCQSLESRSQGAKADSQHRC